MEMLEDIKKKIILRSKYLAVIWYFDGISIDFTRVRGISLYTYMSIYNYLDSDD